MSALRNSKPRSVLASTLAAAVLAYVALIIIAASTAFAADNRLQTQALGVTAQLNGNCTATLISSHRDSISGEVETIFLTAKHCVTNDKADQVLDVPVYQKSRVVKKDRYIAKVRGKHFASDLALLELKDKQTFFAQTAKIAPLDGTPAMGDAVWTVGYPMGLQLTVTTGLFGSLETLDFPTPGTEFFRATPDIAGGNSGGAMYRLSSDGNYELIGVTSAGHKTHSFVGLYTPLEVIHAYLKVAVPSAVGAKRP